MLRIDIEQFMKKNKLEHISLVCNESDKLGIYCYLSGGYLVDYTGHRVDRKKNIWGFIKYENGKPTRIAWESLQM